MQLKICFLIILIENNIESEGSLSRICSNLEASFDAFVFFCEKFIFCCDKKILPLSLKVRHKNNIEFWKSHVEQNRKRSVELFKLFLMSKQKISDWQIIRRSYGIKLQNFELILLVWGYFSEFEVRIYEFEVRILNFEVLLMK